MGKAQRKLKATLQSQQSRLQVKQKQQQAAKDAEQRLKQRALPTHKGKDKAILTPRYTVPFKSTDKILLIGEGNFSFARALVQDPPSELAFLPAENITATAYDTEPACYEKYPDAASIVTLLRERGVEVRFEVDASKLDKISAFKSRRWDRIVWNFPHAGKGIADMERNILSNQLLILSFLRCAANHLTQGPVPTLAPVKVKKSSGSDVDTEEEDEEPVDTQNRLNVDKPARGTVLFTMKNSPPYTLWDVPRLAKRPPAPESESSPPNRSYVQLRSFKFHRSLYKGYGHRMTKGARPSKLAEGDDRTWEFHLKPQTRD